MRPRKVHDARPRGEDPSQLLGRLLASTPALEPVLAGARRVTPARIEADFSYYPSAYAGDRWLLAGDAGSFLDPVFSTGVQVALESGIEAADAVHRALEHGRPSHRAFARFERDQRRRYRHFRRFVHGFYDPAFRDLFFHPTNRFGLLDALVSSFAGGWRPNLADRARIAGFFALVALQRRLAVVPRLPASQSLDPNAQNPARTHDPIPDPR